MDKAIVAKQLELYSNAIIAFIVVQGLGYCYTFGTSDRFNLVVKSNPSLSGGLAFTFLLTTVLALLANRYIGRRLEELSGDYAALVRTVTWGKAAVIVLFGLLPFAVTVRFGMFAAG
jgi:hypothetical protein